MFCQLKKSIHYLLRGHILEPILNLQITHALLHSEFMKQFIVSFKQEYFLFFCQNLNSQMTRNQDNILITL